MNGTSGFQAGQSSPPDHQPIGSCTSNGFSWKRFPTPSRCSRMKTIALILFALLLFTGAACTKVSVSVRQHVTSSGNELTGTNCKLQRELKNQKQQTSVWCWAASAHTVIEYLKNEPIRQCDLVDARNRGQLKYEWDKWVIENPGENPDDYPTCCKRMPEDGRPLNKQEEFAQNICWTNGWPEYIFRTQEFRTHFDGYEYNWTIPYPNGLSWGEIVEEICADRPMISAILYTLPLGGGAHTVVIGGYHELEDGSQWVDVYDPALSTEEDFYLWPYDVYLGDPGVFAHVRDYKNISVQ
jgi:hypothetical protein